MLNDATLVHDVLADPGSASISERDRALYEFVVAINAGPAHIRPEDVERARAAGWSDDALYDAITVCALFRFYNTWVDGSGVGDLPAELYAMQAHRLASEGYAPG